jgi:excisionase family DNA binding protein
MYDMIEMTTWSLSLMKDRPELFHRKLVVTGAGGGYRIYADAHAKTFGRLAAGDLLDTADLCRILGCSTRTIYRWISEEDLRWELKVGREYLFRKDDILDFYNQGRPQPGRPAKRGK